jgi:IS5 family transposase
MSAALPSQPAPSPRGRNPLPVEALQDLLGGLLREREILRTSGVKRALERNRREIVRVQWDLTHALVERYG